MTKKVKFYIINILLVIVLCYLIILFSNGPGNEYPMDLLATSIIISIPIIYFQYPILNYKKNWIYKSLIFYLSMVVFLFILGIIFTWNEDIGYHEVETLIARFDSGARMIIFGQLFGGLYGFFVILSTNLILKDEFFKQ